MLEHSSHVRLAAKRTAVEALATRTSSSISDTRSLQIPLQLPRPRLCSDAGVAENIGRRGWTRTSDPQLRRLMLYPAELRARILDVSTGVASIRRNSRIASVWP